MTLNANHLFGSCSVTEIKDKSIMNKIDKKLEKENDHGFIEYKLKLTGIEEERFNHLVSQMKFRISEGEGEAIYEIGVTDDGIPEGLEEDEYRETLQTIRRMATKLGADVTVLCEKAVSSTKKCAELLVRKYVEDSYVDVRVAVGGEQGAGKSTLIGVITSGELDDGRGSARTHVFLHTHEIESGRTSALSHQILAFDAKGQVINYAPFGPPSWQSIIEQSSKICTFIDLAGHEKYLKTTVHGMAGSVPDYLCLVIAANKGVSPMTREHLRLALALRINVFVVITKTDRCKPEKLEHTKEEINLMLSTMPGSARKLATYVKTKEEVIAAAKALSSNEKIVPVFEVSSTKGTNLDLIRQLVNILPCRRDWTLVAKKPFEMTIQRCYDLYDVKGLVVSGLVMQGSCVVGDKMKIGPDKKGQFYSVTIQSIHRNHVAVRYASAGNLVSLEIRHIPSFGEIETSKDIFHKLFKKCRGIHLLATPSPRAVHEFEAIVIVLYKQSFQKNYTPLLHIRHFSQTAKILSIQRIAQSHVPDDLTLTPHFSDSYDFDASDSLQTGDRALVRFRFCVSPVFVKKQDRILFREGMIKGIGHITQVYYDKS